MSDHLAHQQLCKPKLLLLGVAGCSLWFTGVMHAAGFGYQLPLIGEELGASPGQTQWLMSGFNIIWGSFALVSGRVADIYGLKRICLLGIGWLALVRAISAIGFSIATPSMQGIFGRFFPEGRPKTLAFSFMAGSGAVGAGVGFAVGGFLGELRYNFRIYTGIMVACLTIPFVLTLLIVPKDVPHPKDTTVDWLGAALLVITQLSATLAMTLGVTEGWNFAAVYVLFGLTPLLLAAFLWRQWYLNTRQAACVPLVPLRLVRGRGKGKLMVLYVSSVFVSAGLHNSALAVSYYYREVPRVSARQAGLWVLPSTTAGVVASIFVAFTVMWMPKGLILWIFDTLNGLGCIIFTLRDINSPYWHYDLWMWIVAGSATDATQAVGNIMVSQSTAPEDQATAIGLFLTFSRFGSAVGLAIVNALRDAVARRHQNWDDGDRVNAIESGLMAAMYFCGACMIFGLLALVGIRGRWNIHKRQPDDVNTPTHQVEDLQKVAEAERDGAQAGSTEMSQLEAK